VAWLSPAAGSRGRRRGSERAERAWTVAAPDVDGGAGSPARVGRGAGVVTPKGRYKVLVVDDDPSVLATYRRLLCRAGYTTLTEDDPRKVLAREVDATADLLLLDYKMPGMDGLALLAELRRRACRARCILVSAFLNEDVRRQAADLGVDQVLEKPVDACRLRRAIDDLLPLVESMRSEGTGCAEA